MYHIKTAENSGFLRFIEELSGKTKKFSTLTSC